MEHGAMLGLPYYTEADFKEIVAMLPPSERSTVPTYTTFKANFAESEQQAQRDQRVTARVPISASALKAWCEERKLPLCRRTIFEYESQLITQATVAAAKTKAARACEVRSTKCEVNVRSEKPS